MANENQQPNDIEAQLRNMAAEADNGETTEFPDPFDSAETTDGDRAPSDADKDKGGEPEKKDELKTNDATKKPGDGTDSEKDKEQKEDTQYQRAKKEADRRDRSWKALDAEKETLRKEREEIERQRKEVSTPKKEEAYRDEHGFAAEDYEAAAKRFSEEGNDELAKRAQDTAKAIREKGVQTQREAFTNEWRSIADKLCEEKPDLKNPASDLSKRVQQLLKDEPYFSNVPDGFKRAVSHAEALVRAESVPSLEGKVAELQKEIDRLNKLTQPGGSGPTSKPTPKKFEDMSSDEQERQILKDAEEADSHGGLAT